MHKGFIDNIYIKISDQSKKTFFFEKILVPKNFRARLEIFELNLILILWYAKINKLDTFFSESLLKKFIKDLENAIREMGVSDLAVGKKIKILVENFYGRLSSYTSSFEKNKNRFESIKEIVLRNFSYSELNSDKLTKYIDSNILNLLELKTSDFFDLKFEYVDDQI